ncbi:MAG TPA: hypothetical protein VEU97_13255 [Ktedonobacteraceae bacterium]|nr:hypothetical protein [Ktedonobacteraceae bacterium]
MENNQANAVLYYDTCDEFLTDIGIQLEQAITPSIPVRPQKILGGASPLLPVLELIINYGPLVAGTASVFFFTGVLNKAGANFYDLIKNKLTKHKNDKIVLFTIVTVADEITVKGYIKFDDYETITKALKAAPQMINDAYEKQLINHDQLQEGPPIYYRYTQSQSDFQIQDQYDSAIGLWIPESFHKPNKGDNKPFSGYKASNRKESPK